MSYRTTMLLSKSSCYSQAFYQISNLDLSIISGWYLSAFLSAKINLTLVTISIASMLVIRKAQVL